MACGGPRFEIITLPTFEGRSTAPAAWQCWGRDPPRFILRQFRYRHDALTAETCRCLITAVREARLWSTFLIGHKHPRKMVLCVATMNSSRRGIISRAIGRLLTVRAA